MTSVVENFSDTSPRAREEKVRRLIFRRVKWKERKNKRERERGGGTVNNCQLRWKLRINAGHLRNNRESSVNTNMFSERGDSPREIYSTALITRCILIFIKGKSTVRQSKRIHGWELKRNRNNSAAHIEKLIRSNISKTNVWIDRANFWQLKNSVPN